MTKAPSTKAAPAKAAASKPAATKAEPKAAKTAKEPATKDAAVKETTAAKETAGKTSKASAATTKTKAATGKTAAPPKGAKIDKPKAGNKPNALQQPLQPSEELAAVVGKGAMARGQVVSKVWEYIRANNLQNPEDKREILADDKLQKVFGKDRCTMFEMNKYLAQHLK